MTGAKVEPFAIEVNADGTKGYYSVFYVRADSPTKSIEDLKGKNLGLVDPNSTSGNNVPRFALEQDGHRSRRQFFAKVSTPAATRTRSSRCSRAPSTSRPTGGTTRPSPT